MRNRFRKLESMEERESQRIYWIVIENSRRSELVSHVCWLLSMAALFLLFERVRETFEYKSEFTWEKK